MQDRWDGSHSVYRNSWTYFSYVYAISRALAIPTVHSPTFVFLHSTQCTRSDKPERLQGHQHNALLQARRRRLSTFQVHYRTSFFAFMPYGISFSMIHFYTFWLRVNSSARATLRMGTKKRNQFQGSMFWFQIFVAWEWLFCTVWN